MAQSRVEPLMASHVCMNHLCCGSLPPWVRVEAAIAAALMARKYHRVATVPSEVGFSDVDNDRRQEAAGSNPDQAEP